MEKLWPIVFRISSMVTSLEDFKASLWAAFLYLLENPKIKRINCNQETTDLEVTTWTQDFMSPKFSVVAPDNRSPCWDSWWQVMKDHRQGTGTSRRLAPVMRATGHSYSDCVLYLWEEKVHYPWFTLGSRKSQNLWPLPKYYLACATWKASGLRNTVSLGTNRAII